MWRCPSSKFVVAGTVVAAGLCALVLGFEALREPRESSWCALSGGLGIGSRASVGAGFFDFDPRLETQPDSLFAPLPGTSVDRGPGGVFSPSSRLGIRGR